jgi:hypothetical protein
MSGSWTDIRPTGQPAAIGNLSLPGCHSAWRMRRLEVFNAGGYKVLRIIRNEHRTSLQMGIDQSGRTDRNRWTVFIVTR